MWSLVDIYQREKGKESKGRSEAQEFLQRMIHVHSKCSIHAVSTDRLTCAIPRVAVLGSQDKPPNVLS